jgi:hypothetical protein
MKKFLFLLLLIFIFLFVVQSAYSQSEVPHQPPPKPTPDKFIDIEKFFTASGLMGDAAAKKGTTFVQLLEDWRENCHSPPVCIKILYTPGHEKKWAGVYWQNKADNWGDLPGEDFSKSGYKRVTFSARGEKGVEIVEFKAGGINTPGKSNRDSFEVSTGKIYLEKDWKQYSIDLHGKNLSSVIGGFSWVASQSANPNGLAFYLDDIRYE